MLVFADLTRTAHSYTAHKVELTPRDGKIGEAKGKRTVAKQIKYGKSRRTNQQVDQLARASQGTADFGYGGRERGNEAHDRVQREAYPNQLAPRSAYSYIIGEPPTLGPADYTGARQILTRIDAAIEHGGWTRAEWGRLHRMRDKWQVRANGKDHRFNAVGNQQGGLSVRISKQLSVFTQIQAIRKSLDGGQEGE